jgi:hypothetical protein
LVPGLLAAVGGGLVPANGMPCHLWRLGDLDPVFDPAVGPRLAVVPWRRRYAGGPASVIKRRPGLRLMAGPLKVRSRLPKVRRWLLKVGLRVKVRLRKVWLRLLKIRLRVLNVRRGLLEARLRLLNVRRRLLKVRLRVRRWRVRPSLIIRRGVK